MKTIYEVATGQSKSDLTRRVQRYLNNGWRCQGGVAIGVDTNYIEYLQAMVKEVDDVTAEAFGK